MTSSTKKNLVQTLAFGAGVLALAAIGLLTAASSAQAAPLAVSVGIAAPGVSVGFTNAPGYYAPRVYNAYPRYYAPRVVYNAPAPVYYTQPAPVVYESAPVYYDQAYVPGVVYPAGYWVGWRQGYVRYQNRWVHPSYVRGHGHR